MKQRVKLSNLINRINELDKLIGGYEKVIISITADELDDEESPVVAPLKKLIDEASKERVFLRDLYVIVNCSQDILGNVSMVKVTESVSADLEMGV